MRFVDMDIVMDVCVPLSDSFLNRLSEGTISYFPINTLSNSKFMYILGLSLDFHLAVMRWFKSIILVSNSASQICLSQNRSPFWFCLLYEYACIDGLVLR